MVVLDWSAFMNQTDMLSNIILQTEWKPDMLIAVARGGWILTRMLSDSLGVKEMASIGITYRDTERTKLDVYSMPEIKIVKAKLLLIDDRLESATSLKYAKEILTSLGHDVKTACLFTHSKNIIVPDFQLEKIDDEVIFPWELERKG